MSDSKSLPALVSEYQRLLSLLLECGGELTPQLEQELTATTETLAKKADSYEFVLSKLETEEMYWRSRAEEFVRVARACAAAQKRMRDTIKFAMNALNATEIAGESVTFKLVKAPPKLVTNEKELSDEYIKQTIIREPNKERIRAALADGISVDGATLEPVQALRITLKRKEK